VMRLLWCMTKEQWDSNLFAFNNWLSGNGPSSIEIDTNMFVKVIHFLLSSDFLARFYLKVTFYDKSKLNGFQDLIERNKRKIILEDIIVWDTKSTESEHQIQELFVILKEHNLNQNIIWSKKDIPKVAGKFSMDTNVFLQFSI
jgi:hypothetical protein